MIRAVTIRTVVVFSCLAVLSCSSAEDSAPCDPQSGVVCTWAGNGEAAFDGDGNALTDSSFYWPIHLTFTQAGETYILDWNNHRVRRVTESGTLQTVIGNDFIGDGPEDRSDLTKPGAPGTEVTLNHPTQLLDLGDDGLLLLAWHNHKLRHYDPATGRVYVMCGSGAGFAGDGGPALEAKLNQPQAAVRSADGVLYILDQRNQAIRAIGADGLIRTVAGTPTEAGFAGDGGEPLSAKFSFPTGSNPPPSGGMTLDAKGRLYVSDTLNHRVRVMDFDANTINTVAGTGVAGFGGDGGPATAAVLNNPRYLEIGPDGRLYVADELNHRIRAIDLDSGIINTVVGTGEGTFNGDGLPPLETALNRPSGVVFGPDGMMYILDTYNHRIRRMPQPSKSGAL